MRTFRLPYGVLLSAGPGVSLECGALYMPSNSNNPASARASIDLTLNMSLGKVVRIGRFPVRFSDTLTLPSAGIFFSPQYGESYYEIYLGNHSGLVHFGWWGNHFAFDNLLSAEFSAGPVNLRFGYRFEFRSGYVCSLNSEIVTHSFVVGIVTDALSLSPRKKVSPASTVFYPY